MIYLIAKIKENGQEKYKLLNYNANTKEIKSKTVSLTELKQYKAENVKVEKNEVKGINGSIDRYTEIENGEYKKKSIVILGKYKGIDKYIISNATGEVEEGTEKEIIEFLEKHKEYGIANGKIVEKDKKYLSAIEGEYKVFEEHNNNKYYIMHKNDKVIEFTKDINDIQGFNIINDKLIPICVKNKDINRYDLMNWLVNRRMPQSRQTTQFIMKIKHIRDNTTVNSSSYNINSSNNNNSIMTQALNPSTYAIYDADAGEIARNVRKKIQEGLWEDREAERDKIARMYAKKNTDPNNPAQYINSLGNGNYVVKFGLVVPSEENATYYESLRGQDKISYWYTEWLCFKQNNQGRISFAKDSIPRAKYKENTFGDLGEGNVGMMLWVSRTPNEERVTFWEKPQYAHVHKTFPEYYDKCGGTDMAFMQWGAYPMAYAYDYTYNKIVEGVFEKENNLLSLMDREYW